MDTYREQQLVVAICQDGILFALLFKTENRASWMRTSKSSLLLH